MKTLMPLLLAMGVFVIQAEGRLFGFNAKLRPYFPRSRIPIKRPVNPFVIQMPPINFAINHHTDQPTMKPDEVNYNEIGINTSGHELNSLALKQYTTEKINAYNYTPPEFICYGADAVKYPAYRGDLPENAINYLFTRNKYRKLLTGLVLYKLANGQHATKMHKDNDVCKFVVAYKKQQTYDMFLIECSAIGSIVDEISSVQETVKTSKIKSFPFSDPRFSGPTVEVTPDMECSVQVSRREKKISCELLQAYVDQSFNRRNSASVNTFYFIALLPPLILCL